MYLVKAEANQIEKIVAMSVRAFETDVNVGGIKGDCPPEYDSIKWHQQMAREGHLYQAMIGNDLVGAAIVFPDETENSVYIGRIFIDSIYHRKGFGIRLMDCIEKNFPWAAEFHLDTPCWNERTNAFYKRLGYRIIKNEDGFVFYQKRKSEPNKEVLYIHGKGGSAAECEYYKPLFPNCEVIGLDYQTFTPWETGAEIRAAVEALKAEGKRVILIANSIGAYFSMNAGIDGMIEKAWFISPIVDMERLITDMMRWANVTEAELEARGVIFAYSLSDPNLMYIPNVERMHTQLKKYNVAFTETTAENAALKKENASLEAELDAKSRTSFSKQPQEAQLHREYQKAKALLEQIPKEILDQTKREASQSVRQRESR